MSAHLICSNSEAHGLLSKRSRMIFAGYVVMRNLKRKSTDSKTLLRKLFKMFSVRPQSTSWLSEFSKQSHLSYRNGSLAKWSEKSPSKYKEAFEYLKKLRKFIARKRIGPEHIYAFDKTKFYLDTRRVKQLSIKGGYESHR